MVGAFTRSGLLLCLALSASGCSGSVERGSALYADARYIEAAEVFERTEYQLPQMSAAEQARYGLYRGVTMLALGDLRTAQRWMDYAYAVQRAHPGVLATGQRALLDRAYANARSTQPPPALPPGTALAASQPPPPVPAPVLQPSVGPAGEPAPALAPAHQRSFAPR